MGARDDCTCSSCTKRESIRNFLDAVDFRWQTPLRRAILSDIMNELYEAMKKFPDHPSDPIHSAAICAEEAGELVRATLQWTYEGGSKESAQVEAIQTAAMAIRFLLNSNDFEPVRTDK